ncbi:MAG: hypothetical protein Q4A18_06750 [Rikenellaceae bacterium]|nr:hypothetical protein [Rikenellaceae bacterium]
MQQQNNRWFILLVAFLFASATATAQSGSINAFSPYTMYGIGEVNTPGSVAQRSMGGVGVAARQTGMINLLNPAANSLVQRKSFLVNFAGEGQNYYNKQTVGGQEKKAAHNSFSIRDIAVLMPLHKNLGLSVSVTPYSSVGYKMMYDHTYDENDPVWGNVGRVNYQYQGEGDLTEVKLAVGYQLFKNFSVGAAVQYYWGTIDRTFVMVPVSIVGNSNFGSITGDSEYSVSRFKAQLGAQWTALLTEKRILTFGAVYDFGGDLDPNISHVIKTDDLYETTVSTDADYIAVALPRRLSLGAYYQTAKWALGLDYDYNGWAGSNKKREMTGVDGATGGQMEVAYRDTHTLKAGVEFTPARYDVRRFFNRWSYRAGIRYGSYHQTYDGHELNELAVTAGLGVPFKFLGMSGVDVAFEYGMRGFNVAKSVGLVRQDYFKFSVGFRLFASGTENNEYWFMRPKYD